MLRRVRKRMIMLREDDDAESDDVEEEDDDADVEDDDVEEEENRSQDRDPQCVRACAVEMHLDTSEEPLCARSLR